MSEFDPSQGSHTVPGLAIDCNLRLTGPEIRAFSRIQLGLHTPNLPVSRAKCLKVSGPITKNSRLTETISRDWCDHHCRPTWAVRFGHSAPEYANFGVLHPNCRNQVGDRTRWIGAFVMRRNCATSGLFILLYGIYSAYFE